jgi:hypothetical protein
VWIAGAAFLLDALCFEHWRKWVKAIAIATILVLEFGYSVAVGVGLPAPVELVGYSTPEHPIGSNIEGLAWHPHLTDARIAISNLSTTEYSKLDALIRPLADDPEPGMPYSLVYDARMVGESYGCHIYRAGGNSLNWGIASGKSAKAEAQDGKERKFTIGFTPAGDKVDGYDTDGDPYTTLANDGGFRLRCDSLPPMAGVIAMMAVISPPPRDSLPRLPARKEWSIAAGSFHGTSNPLDIMGDAPNVTSIQIDLDYIRGYRPFSRHEKISVRKQH